MRIDGGRGKLGSLIRVDTDVLQEVSEPDPKVGQSFSENKVIPRQFFLHYPIQLVGKGV